MSSSFKPVRPPLQAAASLLLAIAGPAPEHIVMSAQGRVKYYTVHQPVGLSEALAHLQGAQTIGARLLYPDGTTRALCWDVDEAAPGWQQLCEAARRLAAHGYRALLEPSPAGRGGHLWVIFTALVAAEQARRHVCSLAPELADIVEYWPGRGNQKVRLPGGRYVRPGLAAWCRLQDHEQRDLCQNGVEAARVLLAWQTPAARVLALSPDEAGSARPVVPGSDRRERRMPRPAALPSAGVDPHWHARYGSGTPTARALWFAFSPAYVAAWYNARHDVQELLPPDQHGYGRASWRGERTGSVFYTGDGRGWVDFGASARRPDGRQDGGDALELAARLHQVPKTEILREAARELTREARAALEQAAHQGDRPPAWVQEILTPAGWAYYERLAGGRTSAARDRPGALAGFQGQGQG